MSAAIFNVNYNFQNEQQLPPNLRQPVEEAWLYSITYPLQRLHNLIWINGYADGSLYPNYATSSTYFPSVAGLPGNRVIYIDRGVYECIATASNIAPVNPTSSYWELVNTNYIGASERVQYNSQRILFEYALNRWFQTGAAGNWNSTNPFFGWIYIKNKNVSSNSFVMGQTGQYSSAMYNSTSTGAMFNNPFTPLPNIYCFTILVPLVTANIIDPGNTYSVPNASPNTINIVKSFANTIKLSGILYDVQTY